MKINEACNYLGADWLYAGESDDGIMLKSPSKHLSGLLVPYHRKHMIKEGLYQSQRISTCQNIK